MKKIFFASAAIFIFLFSTTKAFSQEPFPFFNELQKFKQKDSISFPAPNQVLFIGSSSFTMWKDVQDYFPKSKIINRGFGGSSLPDLIRYRYDIIFPYAPKQIVMYCGENDFSSSNPPSVETVFQRFKTLMRYIRNKYPKTTFVYVSMKPSPSRRQLVGMYKQANSLIREELKKDKHAKFVDVFTLMHNQDGSIRGDIFLKDSLHMNAKGYEIWKKALTPYIKK